MMEESKIFSMDKANPFFEEDENSLLDTFHDFVQSLSSEVRSEVISCIDSEGGGTHDVSDAGSDDMSIENLFNWPVDNALWKEDENNGSDDGLCLPEMDFDRGKSGNCDFKSTLNTSGEGQMQKHLNGEKNDEWFHELKDSDLLHVAGEGTPLDLHEIEFDAHDRKLVFEGKCQEHLHNPSNLENMHINNLAVQGNDLPEFDRNGQMTSASMPMCCSEDILFKDKISTTQLEGEEHRDRDKKRNRKKKGKNRKYDKALLEREPISIIFSVGKNNKRAIIAQIRPKENLKFGKEKNNLKVRGKEMLQEEISKKKYLPAQEISKKKYLPAQENGDEIEPKQIDDIKKNSELSLTDNTNLELDRCRKELNDGELVTDNMDYYVEVNEKEGKEKLTVKIGKRKAYSDDNEQHENNFKSISAKMKKNEGNNSDTYALLPKKNMEGKNPQISAEFPKVFDNFKVNRRPSQARYMKCEQCPKVTGSGRAMREHIYRFHRGEATPKVFTCDLCPKEFNFQRDLSRHRQNIHAKELGLKKVAHVCKICGKNISNAANLRVHMDTHSEVKRFVCELCGRSFSQLLNLKSHLKTHGGKESVDSWYDCRDCDQKFRKKTDFEKHLKMHAGRNVPTCKECGKTFVSKSKLRTHKVVHLAVKPFPCKICHLSFSQAGILRKHMQSKHSIDTSFKCDKCDMTFHQERQLKNHVAVEHML